MPRSILFTTFVVISQLAAEAHAKEYTKTISLNYFESSCAFDLGGYSYNICPLVGRTSTPDASFYLAEDDRGEGSNSGKQVFYFNFRGENVWKDQTRGSRKSEVPSCNDQTWLCLKETNVVTSKNALDLIPLLRQRSYIDGQSRVSVTLRVNEDIGVTGFSLYLLANTVLEHSRRSADIVLSCSETESLRYESEKHGIDSFVWVTPHACPRRLTSSSAEPAEDEVPGENEGEDDLMPPPGMSMIRKLMIIALFALVVPLLCGIVVVKFSKRARHFTFEKFNDFSALPSIISSKLRPAGNIINTLKKKSPFRQGGNRLVLWAQEDMMLLDEDVMVNGSRAPTFDDGWHADGLDEYIPLSINPIHGSSRQVRSYGATPTVETFAERHDDEGWLSGIGRFFRRSPNLHS